MIYRIMKMQQMSVKAIFKEMKNDRRGPVMQNPLSFWNVGFSCDETVHKGSSKQKTSNEGIEHEFHTGSGFLQCVDAKLQ